MITRLYIDKMFTHQDSTFEFHKGLTSVTGPNESGKSLITEAIRYALFGSAALRGKASDYKDLHVELDFEVKGRKFTVIRRKAKAELQDDEDQIATGTKPVNEAIQRILGYDLIVFDVANACNQGNIEALTNMTPSERKGMVDRTIGLDVLDLVIDFCAGEANGKKREAAVYDKVMIEPKAPIKPENFLTTFEIKDELDQAEIDLQTYNELKGLLSVTPAKPVKPKACPVKKSLNNLYQEQSAREKTEREIERLQAEARRYRIPAMTEEQINSYLDQWGAYELWLEKKALLSKGENECPSCGHHWPFEADKLKAYELVEEVPKPARELAEVNNERVLLANIETRARMELQIEGLKKHLIDFENVAELIPVRQRYEIEMSNYETALETWKEYNEGLDEKKETFEKLSGIQDKVRAIREQFRVSEIYEREFVAYDRELKNFKANEVVRDQLLAEAEDYAVARKNIQALKIEIKTHLLPSLNKVASALINQMTGGERSEVLIDENFEIEIDGQPVNTLSGSGKAVANLSIRIALGQILTNKVFSVFMADEVDAAMDEERAAYTAECLRRLTDHIGQVVLVTHKRPAADYQIELQK